MGDEAGPGALSGAVRIRLLGPLRVTVGGDLAPVSGRTAARLVITLALAARGPALTIGDIVDAVYGTDRTGYDEPAPSGTGSDRRNSALSRRRSLSTLIWRLRQQWGADAIRSDRYHYWLDTERCTVDAHDFEAVTERARAASRSGDTESAADDLAAALALWPNPGPTSGTAPRVISGPRWYRERLAELRDGAAEQLAGIHAARGNAAGAAAFLVEVVRARPTWEHSQALLVESLLAVGDRGAARQAFDTARCALLDEGVTPGPELAAAGLRAAGVADRAGTAGPAAASMGALAAPPSAVGRDAEHQRLHAAVMTALTSSRPVAVVVSGEAGIGKSTLVQGVLIGIGAALTEARVVTLRCDHRSTLPFGPLADIVVDLPDSQHSVDNIAQVNASVLAAIRALADPGGLVLVIEDLHWAPADTVDTLSSVLQRCGATPLAMIVTTRDPAAHPDFTSRADHRLILTGLLPEDLATLTNLAADSAAVTQLHRLTGGNPLFIRQLLSAGYGADIDAEAESPAGSGLGAGLQPARDDSGVRAGSRLPAQLAAAPPADLTAAIEAHTARVPASVLDALRIAAAIGDHFDLITLAALTGPLRRGLVEWQDAIGDAIRHGLVRPDSDGAGGSVGSSSGYRFVHALITEHLYQQLTPAGRTAAHAAIARALERISLGRRTPPDLLAYHFARGWPELPTADVVNAVLEAARAAGAQLDFRQSATYYRAALDQLAIDPDAAAPRAAVDILGAAAGASVAAGDLAGAADLYASQQRVAREAGLRRAWLFAQLGLLRIAFLRRSRPGVADDLAAAIAEVGMRGDVRGDLGQGTDGTAVDIALLGDCLAAVHVYQPATGQELLHAIAVGKPEMEAPLRLSVWEHQSIAEQLSSARALVHADPSLAVAAWLRLWVSEVAAGLRRLDDPPPRPELTEAVDDLTAFDLDQWRVTRAIATGDLARARALIDAALAAPRHSDPAERARRAVSFYGQQLYLGLAGGTLPEAATQMKSSLTWMTRHPLMRYVRAYLGARGGDPAESARQCLDLVEEIADGDIPDSDLLPRLILLTDVCRQTGNADGLRVCRDALAAHRGEHGIFRFGQYWGAADRSLGDALLALGDRDGAIDAYRSAVSDLELVGASLHLPGARAALDAALQA